MTAPRVLVVYFSRSGTTRAVARMIGAELHADLERLVDRADRRGVLGHLGSFLDSVRGEPVSLLPLTADLRQYDIVVLGAPVWHGKVAAPVRTFLVQHRRELPNIAFFCTCSGGGATDALVQMTELAAKLPLLTLALRRVEVTDERISAKVRTFGAALLVQAKHRAARTDVRDAILASVTS